MLYDVPKTLPMYNLSNRIYGECQIISSNAIKFHKDELINNWVITQLVNGTLYNMLIKDITDLGVIGILHLGLVPEYITPGHTWPIFADSFILFDYIDSLILVKTKYYT